MKDLTPFEEKVVDAILTSEFHDSIDRAENVGMMTWVDCLYDLEQEGLRKSGAMGSLTKKGFIISDGKTVQVTPAGFDAFERYWAEYFPTK